MTHPNICRIYDLGFDSRSDGLLFFTMELLEGETLAQRLTRGAMNPGTALPLVTQMAAALAAAHENGIVHQDFKPSNVMLAPGRAEQIRVVVTDFGMARPAEPAPEHSALMGTPDYMAPEQFTSAAISPATDIYSFGLVIYEMVTGRRPFPAESFVEAALKRLHDTPVAPGKLVAGLDPRWERIILRCLCRKPEDRFQSANEVAAALGAGEGTRGTAEVECPSCRRANPAQARFCEECGAALRRFWVAGSARDCHIVMAQPTVSGHHCRLTSMDPGFVIEDLGSRNGTHLDGRRLEATATVGWGANITLGTGVPFAWEEVQTNPADKVLRIGRDPDNDIVLDHDLVSGYHARLSIVGETTPLKILLKRDGDPNAAESDHDQSL